MSINKIAIASSIYLLFSFGLFAQEKPNVKHDLSCFDTDPASSFKNLGGRVENEFLNLIPDPTAKEQEEYGDRYIQSAKSQYKFVNYGADLQKLKKILKDLNANISNPKGFSYEIYLIDTAMINAFTLGGKILVTTGMVSFCNNDDELACVIGHEIAHNELGHIAQSMKKNSMATNIFGSDLGSVFAAVSSMFSAPFGEIDEGESDMRGMDIAVAAGYDICQNKKLWQRMQQKSGKRDLISALFSTHPYSGTRAECAEKHVKTNYNLNCR